MMITLLSFYIIICLSTLNTNNKVKNDVLFQFHFIQLLV